MKEADFYRLIDQDALVVQCLLCNHKCRIKNGTRGLCKVRENRDGRLFSLVYGKLISEHVDPIEKKPIFHLLPGSLSYSIATVGCNFRCRHCQNYEISQYPRLYNNEVPGEGRTPQEVVDAARRNKCRSISYTYVEPTVFYEFAFDAAQAAHEAGIKNVFVSNGYTSPEATRKIAPILDADNIDLKAFTDQFYQDVCGARLAPVLDTIQLMKELGVWVEVTTLIIPGLNDSDKELRGIAGFIKGIDPGMPWHVSRFFPTYKMTDRPPTPAATLKRARDIGLAAGLKYVYVGNIPGDGGEDTFCPACGKPLITRMGFMITANHLAEGSCRFCNTPIEGIW